MNEARDPSPCAAPTPGVAARLPLAFDAGAMLAEALALPPGAWRVHFNTGYHDGGWSGVTLRGPGGDAARLDVGHRTGAVADTPLLDRCPAVRAALAAFACPVRAARLLRLAPGAVIAEHRDADLVFADGEARLHVPLATGDAVEFHVDGERVVMHPGECWWLDLARPHRVANRGVAARVHLVVDVAVDDWLRGQLAVADHPAREAAGEGGAAAFARFAARITADPARCAALAALAAPDAFVGRVVALGAAEGFAFDAADVRAAMAEGRRRWIEQWMA